MLVLEWEVFGYYYFSVIKITPYFILTMPENMLV